MRPVYLDNNATTPLDPRVLDAMLPYMREEFGNAASYNHSYGRRAREAVEAARRQVAELIGASPREMIWTSGATESDNLAIKGIARMYSGRGRHIVSSPVEHKAVIDSCKELERQGYDVTWLEVDPTGKVSPEALGDAIGSGTILVSLMHANNEIGTVNPLAEIGRICKERRAFFHTDATQAAGRIPVDVEAMGVDLLSMSAHKMYGPKGVGALYVRRSRPRVRCDPMVHGGGHERGLRSGTLNVPGIVGMGKACEIAAAEMERESARLARLRDRLWEGLGAGLAGISRHGHPHECLPNTLSVSFDGVESQRLINSLDELALSSGSACTTSSLEPSYVLRACGLEPEQAFSSIRFSLGRFNTEEEIELAIRAVTAAVERLRSGRAWYNVP